MHFFRVQSNSAIVIGIMMYIAFLLVQEWPACTDIT